MPPSFHPHKKHSEPPAGSGGGWPGEVIPLIDEDGTMNMIAVTFFTSYTIVVNWTLLQVPRDPATRLGPAPRPRAPKGI